MCHLHIFFTFQDETERSKLHNLADTFTTLGITNLMTLIGFNIPEWLIKRSPRSAYLKKFFKEYFDDFEKTYKEHEKTFDPDNIRDYVDAYIGERRRALAEKDIASSFYGKAGHWSFVNSIFDLFLAGRE